MASERQVWFYKGSAVAEVISPLGRSYTLKSVARPSPNNRLKEPPNGPVVFFADAIGDDVEPLRDLAVAGSAFRIVSMLNPSARSGRYRAMRGDTVSEVPVWAYLPMNASPEIIVRTIEAAYENIELAQRERAAQEELKRTHREMEELNRIGVALSSTRDINTLLNMILLKAREVTGADAGSLYLLEEAGESERRLRFKLTQNDSVQFPFTDSNTPTTENSMAGYVALHGEVINLPDAYTIPPDRPYQFNPKFDYDSGYRTRSMLTLPMKNAKGEVLGVLQLINGKRDARVRLTDVKSVDREVHPFTERDVRLALSLGSQAAVAYENNKLYEDIETLFEGFVKAAVTAIEQRDPTTSGHSFRVSSLTVGLAETVDRQSAGPLADVSFTREQMKEIRYAALLHDFGKVGVREEVLVKAKKLYPLQLQLVQQRFDYIRKELESRVSQQKLQYLLEKSREEALEKVNALDDELRRQLGDVDDYFQFILQVNEPTVLPEGKFERLLDISRRTFADPKGIEHQFLNADEVRLLSIPKGSLDEGERLQIESHVIHTFNFLTQIPWTKEIRGIPAIARAHHEKLNGRGYPYKLRSEDIPLPSKMMTICDIFDALSATDRPYKKAVPTEKALDILRMSVKDSEIDPLLFDLFIEAKIYQLTTKR